MKIEVLGPCIIVKETTGIEYSNQVGGYAVHDLSVEGFIMPLPVYFFKRAICQSGKSDYWDKVCIHDYLFRLFVTDKYKGHCYNGIDSSDADYIEHIFRQCNSLGDNVNSMGFISVDRDMLQDCEEAKVYVRVHIDFKLYEGILTWQNSD